MSQKLWERFQQHYREFPEIGLSVDLSRTYLDQDFFERMESRLARAFDAMSRLERGAIANPDENRMVGHYWLRKPSIAPEPKIRQEIEDTIQGIKEFARQVHAGEIAGEKGAFTRLLVIGIGGSALGPQFVSAALGQPALDKMQVSFLDNTDPDGMDKVLAQIGNDLAQTLVVVISKSGGTKETRNGMLEARAAFESVGLDFEKHAVAVTGSGSELDKVASNWIFRFPMWDWIGGRTSETSAVGLLPAVLQGLNIDRLLAGAAACDEVTRRQSFAENPAAQLALAWYGMGEGHGAKDMVILPYKDRLELFSRYLQQLIMESLGKERDVLGRIVNQGIAVYGNKGSTDQHAYIQQLREGLNNFFVTFIEVLRDRAGGSMEVETGITSGDYLEGFYLGTRQALYENGRQSITITINTIDPFSVGVLIALYERAVGLYASLVNVNAYHQPGVEAGKKAATAVVQLQSRLMAHLKTNKSQTFSASELARALGAPEQAETVFKLCNHLAENARVKKTAGPIPLEAKFGV
jgi:glucose-6-phosphate isomerase